MTIASLITVRTSSSRLPNKCLLPFGNSTVLDFVIIRALKSGLNPIICTSTNPSDQQLAEYAVRHGIKIYFGNLENKIKRWADCVNDYGLAAVHIIDADDPFFDPVECKASFELLINGGWNVVMTSPLSDAGAARVGTSITNEFLNRLNARVSGLNSDNLDVIPWELLLSPEDKVTYMPGGCQNVGPYDFTRLTLDYREDYEVLKLVADLFGPESNRHDIDRFLEMHPEISNINAARTLDFLNNKVAQKVKNFGLRGGNA